MLTEISQHLKNGQRILAVSKKQSPDAVLRLHDLGQRHFGENYIQEALGKIESAPRDIDWHLIGPVQKNKVKFLAKNFAYIHSVDSLPLAELISKKASEMNHVQKIFLQVNVAKEPSKSGFSEVELNVVWNPIFRLQGIKIVGLMTMPPLQNKAEQNRVHYAKLKKLADHYGLKELSMGTSHDYAVALEEGATWIRLGTILFGNRST